MNNDFLNFSKQPSWIPLRAVVTPTLKNNIDYISAYDPALFESLKNNEGGEELEILDDRGFLRCRFLNDRSRWIFGQNNPREELTHLSEQIKTISQDVSLLILMGTVAGYAYKAIADAFLKKPNNILLVVEPTAARLRLCMNHADVRPGLRTGRAHWAIGEPTPDTVFTAIERFNLWEKERAFLLDSYSADWQNALQTFQKDYRKRSEEEMQQKRDAIELLRKETSTKSDDSIQRVLLFDCWKRFPQTLHVRSIESALRERGIEAEIVELDGIKIDLHDAEYRRLNERDILSKLREFQPDSILSYAYHAPQIVGREIFEASNARWIQVASNFAYYDTEYYPREHCAVAERCMIPAYQKRGAPNPFFVPLMANYVADAPVPTSRRHPIVFVGNPFTIDATESERFRQRYQTRGRLWEVIQNAIGELSEFDSGGNLYHFLEENPLPQLDGEREYYEIFRHILCVTSEKRRRYLLERIVGEGLALFGNWENAVADSPLKTCFQRYLPIEEEPAIFSEGSIFLNIHSVANVSGPNMRFFNTAGMGALLLSDGDFGDYLEPDREMVRFSSGDELVEKVRYYLAHPEKADEIRARGLERIQKQWTYSRWVDRVVQEL